MTDWIFQGLLMVGTIFLILTVISIIKAGGRWLKRKIDDAE